ncbi:hypothetical protein HPP92_025655 [Vanilla planifolia]|uniref:Uncharacterized protein n=1 Tax=Vanilla planifolia TaxID=51239 RepID=A0A835PLE5_VANPL|nr:hypothetical protein HPP92_025655 [Vanilla planifolia]
MNEDLTPKRYRKRISKIDEVMFDSVKGNDVILENMYSNLLSKLTSYSGAGNLRNRIKSKHESVLQNLKALEDNEMVATLRQSQKDKAWRNLKGEVWWKTDPPHLLFAL